MFLKVQKYLFWFFIASICGSLIFVFLVFHSPKGAWIGFKPTFSYEVSHCISNNEKLGDIKRGKLWVVYLKKRMVNKQKFYNGVIEKIKNMGTQTAGKQKHISDAIKWNTLNRNLEVEFLKNSIKYNMAKIEGSTPLDIADYCIKKNRLKRRMINYRKTITYIVRDFLFNENETYWKNHFFNKFGKIIF